MNLRIRDARPDEAPRLWQLALRAKAAWGYDRDFMSACAAELFPCDLSLAGVAETNDDPPNGDEPGDLRTDERVVGFYTLEALDEEADFKRRPVPAQSRQALELGHLFIEPSHWRKGVGRALLSHAVERALAGGYTTLIIQGDPNAEGFYVRCGGRQVGTRPSHSIAGRDLPLFEIELASALLRLP